MGVGRGWDVVVWGEGRGGTDGEGGGGCVGCGGEAVKDTYI